MKTISLYTFGYVPQREFEDGALTGFDREALGTSDYETPRAKALYAALEASTDDEEYTLGTLPDGRWALVGLTVTGHPFAVESADQGGPRTFTITYQLTGDYEIEASSIEEALDKFSKVDVDDLLENCGGNGYEVTEVYDHGETDEADETDDEEDAE